MNVPNSRRGLPDRFQTTYDEEPMHAVVRLVSILLAVTLAGGAQACVAVCAPTPAKAAAPPEKSPCHHCPERSGDKSSPGPGGAPCKQCQVATLDRVVIEHSHPDFSPTVELAFWSAAADLAPAALSPAGPAGPARVPAVFCLPADRLHEFCLLLI
jgi:hypothetical protein